MDLQLQEIKALEEQKQLLKRKQHKLQKALILNNDPSTELKLEEDLAQTETVLAELEKELAKHFDFHTEAGKSQLRSKIAELKIDAPLGQIHLVNCDRRHQVAAFWDAFDDLPDAYFHHYFITSCATQMPPSFSERMVYELIIEELDDNDQAILFHRDHQTNRIKIHPLPHSSRNLEKSKHRFRQFFSTFFEFEDHVSFEEFLQTGIPRMKYQYVAMIFEFYQNEWKSFFPEYLNWIISSFQHSHDEVPTFLFFFVTYMEGLHMGTPSPQQLEIVESLEALSQQHRLATHLSAMPPVPVSDLKSWLMKLGNRNPGKLDEIIETLAKGLKGADLEQFRQKQELNMDDVERLQELVVLSF